MENVQLIKLSQLSENLYNFSRTTATTMTGCTKFFPYEKAPIAFWI